ncbi:TIGR02206 family membrane protein [Luteolibacter sp. AS25]|uniref:YwaF family protein n=1 Tax=Luteolibacter sp. AS25 TaxID=3135776 RepID=UPI00398AA01A
MPFHPFSKEHYITLAIGFAIIAILILAAKRAGKNQKHITLFLALTNLLSPLIAYFVWKDYPHRLDNLIPYHLCDLAAIIGGFALLTRKPFLLTLTYFWGLAATLQALLTPAIPHGPPTAPFFHFFIQHFAIVAAALYIPIVLKWRPETPFWKSPLKVFGISLVYHVSTIPINSLLDTNFAFSLSKPQAASLIDHLGPWPVYLFAMQALALVLFLILALPFRKSTR